MRFEEILPALRAGKLVRGAGLPAMCLVGSHLMVPIGGSNSRDLRGATLSVAAILAEDWEIVHESIGTQTPRVEEGSASVGAAILAALIYLAKNGEVVLVGAILREKGITKRREVGAVIFFCFCIAVLNLLVL
jgi:hypothetical protein